MRRILGLIAAPFAALVLMVIVYLFATIVGAVLPDHADTGRAPGEGRQIYLLTTALHADYAIPVDPQIRRRFAWLGDAGLPMENPELRYLVFGWGSKAFYTTAAQYTDIRPGPTFTAVTGDQSVMHVVPAGDISGNANAYPVKLPPGGLDRLLDFVEQSFAGGPDDPQWLADMGFGMGDEFFAANGRFDIFRPCNIWAADGLREAGLSTGRWTPTTFSLILGLRIHSPKAVPDPLF